MQMASQRPLFEDLLIFNRSGRLTLCQTPIASPTNRAHRLTLHQAILGRAERRFVFGAQVTVGYAAPVLFWAGWLNGTVTVMVSGNQ
jgi:hypothetical protein